MIDALERRSQKFSQRLVILGNLLQEMKQILLPMNLYRRLSWRIYRSKKEKNYLKDLALLLAVHCEVD